MPSSHPLSSPSAPSPHAQAPPQPIPPSNIHSAQPPLPDNESTPDSWHLPALSSSENLACDSEWPSHDRGPRTHRSADILSPPLRHLHAVFPALHQFWWEGPHAKLQGPPGRGRARAQLPPTAPVDQVMNASHPPSRSSMRSTFPPQLARVP